MKFFSFLAFIVLFLLLFMIASPSLAHLNEKILSCPVFDQVQPRHKQKLLQEVMAQQGLLAEIYDVTGDGLGDIAVYSATLGGFDLDGTVFHKNEPIFYEIDTDGDENPEYIYIDQFGEASCDSLVLYMDLTHGGNPSHGGLVRWRETRDDLLYDGQPLSEVQQ